MTAAREAEEQGRAAPPRSPRLAWTVAGLVVLAAVGAAVRGNLTRPLAGPVSPGSGVAIPPPIDLPSAESASAWPTDPFAEIEPIELPPWLGSAVATVLIVAVLALLAAMLRRLLASRAQAPRGPLPEVAGRAGEAADTPPDLTDALAEAEVSLRATTAPRDAVVGAWVALEAGAAELGTARLASQTPTEFTVELLSRSNADPAAVAALRAVYLTARFSPEPVTAEAVERAATALERISATWAST